MNGRKIALEEMEQGTLESDVGEMILQLKKDLTPHEVFKIAGEIKVKCSEAIGTQATVQEIAKSVLENIRR